MGPEVDERKKAASKILFEKSLAYFRPYPRLRQRTCTTFLADGWRHATCDAESQVKKYIEFLMETKTFIDSSELIVIIPQNTQAGIEALFANHELGDAKAKSRSSLGVGERSLLHFDEQLSAYIVLKTPYQEEPELRAYLYRLSINLEAKAIGNAPSTINTPDERPPARNEDVIWSGEVDTKKEPCVTIQANPDQEPARTVLATWVITIKLNRPRIRLQSPMIEFRAIGVLSPGEEQVKYLRDPLLPSGVPSSINLLEPLSHDPALEGSEPRLTASRLSRVQPMNRGFDISSRTLKSARPSRFPAVPAISSRVHYTRSKNHAGKASLVASLDLETSPFSNENIEFGEVGMTLSEGHSEDLVGPHKPVPWICRPKDFAVFLFRLTLNSSLPDGPSANAAQMVEVSIDATILVSESCRPKIYMRWKTGVDFSAALNPVYGAPGQSMQRNRRPTSLPMAPNMVNNNTVPISAREDEEIPPTSPNGAPMRQRATSVSDLGITVTFSAPEVVRVGKEFQWNILVLNGSSRPRRLTIMAIPKRRRDWKGHAPKSSTASVGGVHHQEGAIAEAVVDENLLYAMQRNTMAGSESHSQVLCLSTEVKIGPLIPGSCIDAKLEFVPLAKGVLQIEAVRVVDVSSGDAIDIRDLPDIVAEDDTS